MQKLILRQKKELQITNNEAKKIILDSISKFRSAGKKEVDIIDLHNKTHLPIQQISDIMWDLEKTGKVKECA